MSKWLQVGMLAAAVAVVALLALGADATFAQGPTATPPAGLGLHLGGPQNSLIAIAAQTLGMDRTALLAELNAGKTIADVAKTKNVATSKIADALVANRTALLKAAVDVKRITPAQMEAEVAALKTRVTTQINSQWSPRAIGLGRGYGMGMGLGFVDANKDGICDNCSANRPAGQPYGPGGRWSR